MGPGSLEQGREEGRGSTSRRTSKDLEEKVNRGRVPDRPVTSDPVGLLGPEVRFTPTPPFPLVHDVVVDETQYSGLYPIASSSQNVPRPHRRIPWNPLGLHRRTSFEGSTFGCVGQENILPCIATGVRELGIGQDGKAYTPSPQARKTPT
ncbi:hypothetical protein BDN72DRAFT_862570 [Pluteus cervinus]|uniref:Uncharacterized protein n=1 Tax=Pluteus cervinus TaxID=181527 RepID=A0ACD3ABB6_9AGAR|nr:hypothetical protein BDN72DRAFT_862570 [Pluteus cervinus]